MKKLCVGKESLKRLTCVFLSVLLLAVALSGCSGKAKGTSAQGSSGQDESGQGFSGQDESGQGSSGQDKSGQGSSGQNSSGQGSEGGADGQAANSNFDLSHRISVVSREDGSGTRGAFIELMGIEVKNDAGEKEDQTTDEAIITNSTSVMMTTVAGDKYAVGYISLGSLNDTVKALKVDGAEATVDNIKGGTYKIARPFNIATKGEVSEAASDFINFIMSTEGQAVITENKYIEVDATGAFAGTNPTGKVVVAGSSSVTPVMQKLKEAYEAINSNVEIEIQESDSSTGMNSVIDGICDIGMASRELKESEVEAGLRGATIAMDGIAVVANLECGVDEMSSEQVRRIYTGEAATWEDALQ